MGVQSAFLVDPHVLFIGPNMAMSRNLYDSLIGRDEDAHWTPTLATSWNQIDPQTWEFLLRQGVKFSDGALFTAEDVVASVRRMSEAVARLGLTRMYVEPTIAETRGGVIYHPRIDQQMIAYEAAPAP